MTKGVSLLEIIVVIAIISLLALMGVNSINNFKNDAKIEMAANEILSEIRLARNKSMNGELLKGENETDFQSESLPEYGILLANDHYQLIRKCQKIDGTACEAELPLENVSLDSDYVIATPEKIFFSRITGTTAKKLIVIQSKNGKYGRKITISEDFVISMTKL